MGCPSARSTTPGPMLSPFALHHAPLSNPLFTGFLFALLRHSSVKRGVPPMFFISASSKGLK